MTIADDCEIDESVFLATNDILVKTRELVFAKTRDLAFDPDEPVELLHMDIRVERFTDMFTDLVSEACFMVASMKDERPETQWDIGISIHD